jgi:hypothetical protein
MKMNKLTLEDAYHILEKGDKLPVNKDAYDESWLYHVAWQMQSLRVGLYDLESRVMDEYSKRHYNPETQSVDW